MTHEDVRQVIIEMSYAWRGCTYEILTRNCHHFSDAFCRHLGVGRLPPWLNELADTGANAVEFLDRADSGYDGGEAIFEFLNSMTDSIAGMLAVECSDANGNQAISCCGARARFFNKPQDEPDHQSDQGDVDGESPCNHKEDPVANDPFLLSGVSENRQAE